MTRTTLQGERVGLFSIDPGRTTGVAMGDVLLKGSTKEIFDRNPLGVFHIGCENHLVPEIFSEVEGSQEIAKEWLDLTSEWTLDGIPTTHQFFIYEDFILNRQSQSYERSGISPVRVMSLVMGMLVKYKVNYVPQQPSLAKQRWNNDRLRRANLWTVGLEHGRDATRHAALFVSRQMD